MNNIAIDNQKAFIKTQNCIKCGHCVAICPKFAVSMSGFEDAPVEIKKTTVLNPAHLLEALRSRRSIRHFKNRPVEPEILKQIIEAGRLTPTAENAQNVSYIVLQNEKKQYEKIAVRFFKRLLPLARLIDPTAKNIIIDDHFLFKKAPAAILVLSKNKINGALAASNMALMAEAHGLGVLYSGFFTIAANYSLTLHKELCLKQKVVTTLVLGYPNVTYHRTAQKEAAVVQYL